jgi:hypothetical protein
MGSQTRTVDRIIRQPGDSYHDAALAHASRPFAMNGKTIGYTAPAVSRHHPVPHR